MKAGEGRAFEELVRTEGPRMYAVALRYLPHEADAEDALQDALLNAFRGIGSFAGDSRLSTWLHRVTVNAALMRIRGRARRREASADPAGLEETAAQAGSDSNDPVARAEIRDRVRSAIARLPESYRTVLMLRDIEGIHLEEMGRLLGVGLSTVKARLHRARHALRASVGSGFEEATR